MSGNERQRIIDEIREEMALGPSVSDEMISAVCEGTFTWGGVRLKISLRDFRQSIGRAFSGSK